MNTSDSDLAMANRIMIRLAACMEDARQGGCTDADTLALAHGLITRLRLSHSLLEGEVERLREVERKARALINAVDFGTLHPIEPMLDLREALRKS